MKFARCICKDCEKESMIRLNGRPHYCVHCGSKNIKFTWIDRNGLTSSSNKSGVIDPNL